MQTARNLDGFDNNVNDIGHFRDEPIRPISEARAYCEYQCCCVLHVWGRRVSGERKDFCAVFQRAEMDIQTADINPSVEPEFVDCGAMGLPGNQMEQPVFVPVFKITDKAQGGGDSSVGRIRSLLRLHSLDCCPHGSSQQESEFVPFYCNPQFGAVVGDGELNFVLKGRGVLPRLNDCDTKNKVIEGRSEVVDTVSGQQRPSLQLRLLSSVEFKGGNVAAGFRMILLDDSAGIIFVPGAEFVFERIAMYLGAPEL